MRQRRVEVVAGANRLEVDRILGAMAAELVEKRMQSGQVPVAQRTRIANQLAGVFQPLEARRARVVEVELFVVHDLKNHDVMPPVPQQLESLEKPVARHEQV